MSLLSLLCVLCDLCGNYFELSAMNLHEYQAKEVLREYGITTPRGVVIENTLHAEVASND